MFITIVIILYTLFIQKEIKQFFQRLLLTPRYSISSFVRDLMFASASGYSSSTLHSSTTTTTSTRLTSVLSRSGPRLAAPSWKAAPRKYRWFGKFLPGTGSGYVGSAAFLTGPAMGTTGNNPADASSSSICRSRSKSWRRKNRESRGRPRCVRNLIELEVL